MTSSTVPTPRSFLDLSVGGLSDTDARMAAVKLHATFSALSGGRLFIRGSAGHGQLAYVVLQLWDTTLDTAMLQDLADVAAGAHDVRADAFSSPWRQITCPLDDPAFAPDPSDLVVWTW